MHDVYPVRLPDRITVEDGDNQADLSQETIGALAEIAVSFGLGYGNALVQAVHDEKFLSDLEISGHKLILEKDGHMKQLIKGN